MARKCKCGKMITRPKANNSGLCCGCYIENYKKSKQDVLVSEEEQNGQR